ncbi:hypothetical protein [Streptomyces sediminimaris]|uniref:hypothetical protein n=1 Tax=Streptomyces sediminimaris TaxID=3383721 RepID=UPI003999A660
MDDQTPPTTLPASGRSYPGRSALDHAESRLRAALARLARDPDTYEQAGALAAAAATALAEITEAAHKAEENSPLTRARMQRRKDRVARQFRRAGRPVPDALKPPQEQPRDGA